MYRIWLVAAALFLGGCADFGAPINGGNAVPPQEARLQLLESKVGELSRRVENLSSASEGQDRQHLEREVRMLRGDVESLRHDVETNEKRGRELYADLDRRLRKLEESGQSARLTLDSRITSAPPTPSDQEEEATYLRVFDQLKAGRYDDAIIGFRSMLERWPNGKYADNALYWTGESHYVKRDYDAAIRTFNSLLERFPASPKAPDAMLKIGLAQAELKKPEDAKATFKRLIDTHPGSNAASLARQRLNPSQ